MPHLGTAAAGALNAALTLAHRFTPSSKAGAGDAGSTAPTAIAPTATIATATIARNAPATETVASTWWICVSGAVREVHGPRARCHTPSQTIDVVPSCGVGHALVPNLSGNRDRCRNAMGGLLDYTCPVPHVSPVITTGQDIGRRMTNGSVSPPSIKISY